MRIVARAAHGAVRLELGIEGHQLIAHLVTREALLLMRHERRARGVERGLLRDRRGEAVARHAVQVVLPRHRAEDDLRLFRLVAARLAARLVDGDEAMDLDPVALDAHEIGKRVGLQMDAVAGRGHDALPDAVRVLLDVARAADGVGDRRVRADILGPIQHPEIDLPDAGANRLLVAVVALELRVLAGRELLERDVHDVARLAEFVVVLHEAPALPAETHAHDAEHQRPTHDPHLELPASPAPPRQESLAAQPDESDEGHEHDAGEHEPADHHPLRHREEEAGKRSCPRREWALHRLANLVGQDLLERDQPGGGPGNAKAGEPNPRPLVRPIRHRGTDDALSDPAPAGAPAEARWSNRRSPGCRPRRIPPRPRPRWRSAARGSGTGCEPSSR